MCYAQLHLQTRQRGNVQVEQRTCVLFGQAHTWDVCQGPVIVRMHWLCPALRVSVWDESPDLPPFAPGVVMPDPAAPCGRGLPIVESLADRWGGCGFVDGPNGGPGGQVIWFELALGDHFRPPSPVLAA
ncbi:ATP-binding protein [Streptomyces sp. NPDC000070]|uniref:ATP-binding protein n=1 Tax=Streptomyces sp. NPDC000070 TaxID=3154240 RepID=UPI003321DBF0